MVKNLINLDTMKWLLTAAWAAGFCVFGYVLTINNRLNEIENLEQRIIWLENDSESTVKKDVYEVDKMLMIERLKR